MRLFVFGLGYTARVVAAQLEGWSVEATGAQGTFLVDGALLRDLAPALVEQGFLFSTELAGASVHRDHQPAGNALA